MTISSNVLTIKEQDTLPLDVSSKTREDLLAVLNNNEYKHEKPEQLLGLDWGNRGQTMLRAKYFIGLKWIKEDESAIYVHPKIDNLDFMTMFMHCFDNECSDVSKKLGEIYGIDFHKNPIRVKPDCIELTPILIVHFLKLVHRIIKRGLKSNYIQREENLSSKIKGKVLLSQSIKRNYSAGRQDRTMCRYQDYSIDCIENRILKMALLFVRRFLNVNKDTSCHEHLNQTTTFCLAAMSDVGDDVSLQMMKQFKVNPLYREYAEAMRVAMLILKRFSYNIELVKKDADRTMPPFWINMALLFELYVYGLLKQSYGNQIHHHISTYGNEIDFVKYDEKLIIDTKYIIEWKNRVNHDNARQLSGYARNIELRKKVTRIDKDETTILDCLIIYPDMAEGLNFPKVALLESSTKIDTYLKIHKMAIKLPAKNV